MMYDDHFVRFDSHFRQLHHGAPSMAILTMFNSGAPLLTSLKGPLVGMRSAGSTGSSSGGVGALYISPKKHHLNSTV
jgi:hypothetical protein